jgi:PDZ domain
MATPYTQSAAALDPQWQEPRNPAVDSTNFRSVTPAMNNTRGGGVRAPSPTPARGPSPARMAYNRSVTPNRYDSFQTPPEPSTSQQHVAPAQSGLIRLSLRKPMGIVFEPMYDPNAPLVQRGVRICDLPRTGAAALSRRLEVGDELLSINDKTMSRLTFDEIMDFIIEADPEDVNLLFRRPNKETLKERAGIKSPTANPSGPGVKWVDDQAPKNKKEKASKKKDKEKKASSRRNKSQDDDETLQSEDVGYRNRRRKGRRKDPYETESFLDVLIDTICANPDSVCRDRRRGDDDDYSDDDETFASRDDSTYLTYESEDHRKSRKQKAKLKGQNRDDDSYSGGETEEDTLEDKQRKGREKDAKRNSPPPKEKVKRSPSPPKSKTYEDDNTLETMDTAERAKHIKALQTQDPDTLVPPLGLAPNPEPNPAVHNIPEETDDEGNPAPIKEVEYDDQVDHSADVSVMESLGGPSLLIEKQRAQQIAAMKPPPTPPVPAEIFENFGHDYPLDFGFSREQTIQNDPLRFYTFVVKSLLQEHEPEKVRLLDKLLAKYKGREDHLVQKLSVRYNKDEGEEDFDEAVRKEKNSAHVRSNVDAARERIQNDFPTEWPEKETKEGDPEDEPEDGSEYSAESIDGTSPAVIAQVSELLNYVYGKTSVPGQIDRVSTIMRAYEGREAVLLELLETKALIKANREKENAGALPAFLRNSNAQRNMDVNGANGDMPAVTPMASSVPNDDISSMSGVSTPAAEAQQISAGVLKQISVSSNRSRLVYS